MCPLIRQSTLAIIFILAISHAQSQTNRCDSIQWNFDVNQFAIDGDNLMADFAEKGWTPDFFQTNEIDVTIYGATDCPGTYEYNSKLAGNRALYLRNYFEVSEFPKLTIANSYAIPERNCVKPGQGYNRADRVTALKVCWAGEAPTVAEHETKVKPVSDIETKPVIERESEPVAVAKSEAVTETKEEPVKTEQPEIVAAPTVEPEKPIAELIAEEPLAPKSEAVPADSAQTQSVVVEEKVDSIAQTIAEMVVPDSVMSTSKVPTEIPAEVAVDSINVAAVDSTIAVVEKPKKVFDIESTPELNEGDELIMDGLNFYPGSHRTIPEAKPILKKLLQLLKENPTLMIEIQGHVCCASKPNEDGLDDETGDFKLSWNRAQYVRDYLVKI